MFKSSKSDGKSLGVLEKGMWVDFVDNNERAQRVGYRRLITKDGDEWNKIPATCWTSVMMSALNEAFMLIAVSPYELPGRIARSMVPPILHKFRVIHVDFLGPAIAVLSLIFLLKFGQAEKDQALRAEAAVLSYCFLLPVFTFVMLKCCQAAITFMQLVSLIGYSLYGPVFTLSVSLLVDHERSNTIFFLCLAVFGGLSTMRVVLALLASLRIPAARLLICASVALFQLLFVVWLHFTYLHPTFVFGSGNVVLAEV